MQDNPNTENTSESLPLDCEDWEIAFKPYRGNPGAALQLAFHLIILQAYISVEPADIRKAANALDRALDALYPHTEFHLLSMEWFKRVVEGRITFEEEQLLNALGIKF